MERRRPRIKRKLYALLLLLLLLGLLELNRMLPGVWPGGGDSSGLRQHVSSLVGDGGANPLPDDTGDTTGMRAPPEGRPPPEVVRGGAVVELRLADGTFLTDWRFGIGSSGTSAEVLDPELGRKDVKPSEVGEPIRVRTRTHSLEHHPLTAGAPVGHWVVVLPDDPCHLGRRRSRASVELRDPSGELTIDAEVDVSIDGGDVERRRTDRAGRILLSGLRALTHVARLIDNEVVGTCWVATRGTEDVVLALPPKRVVHASGVFDAKTEAVTPDGRRLPVTDYVETADGQQVRFEVGVAADTPLVLVGRTGLGMEFAHRADDGQSKSPPDARIVEVLVTGEDGKPLGGAAVVAHYRQALGGGKLEPMPLRSLGQGMKASGTHGVAVPLDVAVDVVVARSGYVPRTVHLDAGADDTVLEMALARGLSLDVHVTRADGSPADGALVRAEVGSGAGRVEIAAHTDAAGIARLEGVSGPTAVFVVGETGAADALEVVDVDGTTESIRIRLEPAAPLTIVVSDPDGVPLEGVRVDVTADHAGGAAIEPPGPADVVLSDGVARIPERQSAFEGPTSDDHGAATIERLPRHRVYQVRLYKRGYAPQTIRAVRPGDRTYFVTLVAKP